MKNRLNIIKIGGHVINHTSELQKFLNLFSAMEGPKILVHGGGKKASELLPKLGIESKMVNGRRITDAKTLEVVTMVYAGLFNKTIVAKLQALNCNAMGLSGADANSIQAHKRPVKEIDYGFAGDIDSINVELITDLLNLGVTPIFCALTHDTKGQLLNTNADTIASELAIGLSGHFKTTLNYCFELNGVLEDREDKDSVIQHMNTESYQDLIKKGSIVDGMLPKLHNCFNALAMGVSEVRIGNLGLFDKTTTNYTRLTL